uniref:Uncharacterized protein n=2 Tax=Clastoptera arizonana TaxID=38151 RepID=A0A1B6EB08_9HEMI
MISTMGSYVSQQSHIDQINYVISDSTKQSDLRNSLSATLSGIQWRKTWAQKYSSQISTWLNTNTDVGSYSSHLTSSFVIHTCFLYFLYLYFSSLTEFKNL